MGVAEVGEVGSRSLDGRGTVPTVPGDTVDMLRPGLLLCSGGLLGLSSKQHVGSFGVDVNRWFAGEGRGFFERFVLHGDESIRNSGWCLLGASGE